MINVLIVDDDAMVAELNKSYLNQISGFSCYATVPTLQQARNLLMQADSGIDLVLLDIYMQQDNGLDLLPTIREFSEKTDVIIISSASDVSSIKKALHYGVVDYLIKPFQFSRFEQALTAYREEANLLKHREFVAQSDIDNLIRRTSGNSASERKKLPKGLTSLTLRTVCEWVEGNQGTEFSTEMLANAIGISRVSCRKYLIYLADTGILATNILYGSTGRPVYLYRLLPEKQDALRQYCE
ncbi:two-component system response regulator DcuR [Brenneria goodwinii]|uniref:Transcriptional regulatory protein n=1 Tax=Brenneria goodwinii TaxID=1109412 RepID=A0A0G4JTG4_9GAMM|nr:two-component system response regulator DcuR [Brenneria goodwinii]ATA26028.1 transcriptional regulator [Brenneria goodwinii]MCG8157845.1 two-component system response regulator DcuR [Brenneria goodwinii]MCG8162851.1 two-component system response regulator DcuR [Brenneria goodwinii]MCG8165073.1 two-component system response regulator DcuR [Brenneria goodwinii]MCG8171641.1 two-component system response regulator DcuR [Brenneria goodwinii]